MEVTYKPGEVYFEKEGPGSGDFPLYLICLGCLVRIAIIPDTVYSAPRIEQMDPNNHLKVLCVARSR